MGLVKNKTDTNIEFQPHLNCTNSAFTLYTKFGYVTIVAPVKKQNTKARGVLVTYTQYGT